MNILNFILEILLIVMLSVYMVWEEKGGIQILHAFIKSKYLNSVMFRTWKLTPVTYSNDKNYKASITEFICKH